MTEANKYLWINFLKSLNQITKNLICDVIQMHSQDRIY